MYLLQTVLVAQAPHHKIGAHLVHIKPAGHFDGTEKLADGTQHIPQPTLIQGSRYRSIQSAPSGATRN